MKSSYLIANWKANKTPAEVAAWINTVAESWPKTSPHLEIVICVPFIHLDQINKSHLPFKIGTQDISPYPDGAYTGAISARMLEHQVHYALVGHSERRRYFHETNAEIALKVSQAINYQITPIVAVTPANWRAQLNALEATELSQCLIMYEPPEAISQQTGPAGVGEATPVDEVVVAIQALKEVSPASPVLYGGSVKSHNIDEYLNVPEIDGVVPGSASLNAKEWLEIVTIFQKIRG